MHYAWCGLTDALLPDVWSMAELTVAIIVVCLPALSSLLYRRGANSSSKSQTPGAQSHFASGTKTGLRSSHYKLSSTTSLSHGPGNSDDTGSDIELNPVGQIYLSEEVHVESHAIERRGSFEVRRQSLRGKRSSQGVGYTVEAWSGNDASENIQQ